jgi:Cu+-exporting ATPase
MLLPVSREPPSDTALYTCPMHPEVSQEGSGSCPFCGMALEPRSASADLREDPELGDLRRRLRIGAVLTAPVFLLAMAGMFPGTTDALPSGSNRWIQLALTTPVVLWCGWPFFERGGRSLRSGHLNMFTLISLGVGAAYGFSVFALTLPGLLPGSLRAGSGEVDVYFESAAVIVCLVLFGQVLELRARGEAGAAIRALLRLAPETARRVSQDGIDEEIPLDSVRVGDRLRVVPGARVPVDGIVVHGDSAVDESMISGEPIPRSKQSGDTLYGGTVNGKGSILMRADRVGSETLLARIVQMVSDAQRSRAPIQRVADAVAAWFVPGVVLVAIAAFAGWFWLGPEPRLGHALVAAVSVLIIACPCALGLATPMSILVASGRGASLGILFRDAEAIERLRDVDTLVVDKTGTLTQGHPALEAVEPVAGGGGVTELLRLAGSLERGSEHPLAAAVVAGALERGIELVEPQGFESFPGKGVGGRIDGRAVLLGSGKLMSERDVDASPLQSRADALRARGFGVMLVAVDGVVAGLLGVADPIKPGTAEAVAALRARGIEVTMLTGDSRATARSVAAGLGIEEVIADVLPEQKLQVIERLQASGRVVAMAGDGVNDAPALARADVGIAMGTGADVAIESAGITLVDGDLRALARAFEISRATVANIRQNLLFAFGYNALGVPIAAGVLYPISGVLLSPMIAAAAMSLSSVSVIANALRLRSVRLETAGNSRPATTSKPPQLPNTSALG